MRSIIEGKKAKKNSPPSMQISSKLMPTHEERMHMIAENAYYRAQARGFQGDMALDDWLAAEAEIAQRMVHKN